MKEKVDYKTIPLNELRASFDKLIDEQKKLGYTGALRVPSNLTEEDEKCWLIQTLTIFQELLNDNSTELWHMTPKGERINYAGLSTASLREVFNAYMEHEKSKGMVRFSFTSKASFAEDGRTEEQRERENMINIMSMHDCYLYYKVEDFASVNPRRKYDFEERQNYEDVTETIR